MATSNVPRGLVIAAEAAVAALVGGVAIGGALGWTIAVLAVGVAVLVPVAARASWFAIGPAHAGAAGELIAKLRVHGVQSRSSGDVGVISDGQGFAAGLELEIDKGALLDLRTLCGVLADDPSRPSAVQVRLTSYAPPMPGTLRRPRPASVAVHRRLHVMLRLEPTRAGDVAARRGGGAYGSRAALVAAIDRLAARLRRAGIAARVVDSDALSALLAEDTAADLRARVITADPGSRDDLVRLIGLLQHTAPERSVLSVCIDLESNDQWQSFAAVLVAGHDASHADEVAAAVLGDACVIGVAPSSAIAAVLPLGGGPGDLASVLTLARV
jgi:hypothetical protein